MRLNVKYKEVPEPAKQTMTCCMNMGQPVPILKKVVLIGTIMDENKKTGGGNKISKCRFFCYDIDRILKCVHGGVQ